MVDPSTAPALAAAEERGWTITRSEHALAPRPYRRQSRDQGSDGRTISAPAGDVPGRDVALEGGEVRIGDHVGRVIEIPGHTLGHIALVFDDERIAFVGDTLFAMGCGRLFEGTPEQMYDSCSGSPRCRRIPALLRPRIYAGQRALRGPRRARQRRIAARLDEVAALRDAGEITLPTTVAEERATNPFVRATDVAGVRPSAGEKTASVHERGAR